MQAWLIAAARIRSSRAEESARRAEGSLQVVLSGREHDEPSLVELLLDPGRGSSLFVGYLHVWIAVHQ